MAFELFLLSVFKIKRKRVSSREVKFDRGLRMSSVSGWADGKPLGTVTKLC